MRLEMAILAGAESKQFLVDLTKIVERMEKAATGKTTTTPTTGKATKSTIDDEEDEELSLDTTDEDEAEELELSDDEDEEDNLEIDEEEEETLEAGEDDAPVTKKQTKGKRAPKVTEDDVQDACAARIKVEAAKIIKRGSSKAEAGPAARELVVKLLKKNFNVTSVSKLDEAKYPAVIKFMNGVK